eukprot:c6992_g1_i4.p1 GENE.c6992_g1_i4~~c6992_g1_i4.p1  ORF type:complete len:114 (-),score=23.59 c6992_g1_i4:31-372(-)
MMPQMVMPQQDHVQAAAVAAAAAAHQVPCNTLFVANLGASTQEEELRDLFSRYPGFTRLRHNGGSRVAFIEFQDASCAAAVIAAVNGSVLRSSDQGPLRVEFAKNPMGTPSKR